MRADYVSPALYAKVRIGASKDNFDEKRATGQNWPYVWQGHGVGCCRVIVAWPDALRVQCVEDVERAGVETHSSSTGIPGRPPGEATSTGVCVDTHA